MLWICLGYFGSFLFLVCHMLISYEKIRPQMLYQCLQIVAAGSLGFSAYMQDYGPTVLMEVAWLAISVAAIVKIRRKKNTQP